MPYYGWNPLTPYQMGFQMGMAFFTAKDPRSNGQLVRTSTFATPPQKRAAKLGVFIHRIRNVEHLGIFSDPIPVDVAILGICFFEVKKGKFPILPLLQLAVRPWKVGFWKTSFLLGRPTFRGYVSCRKCTCPKIKNHVEPEVILVS